MRSIISTRVLLCLMMLSWAAAFIPAQSIDLKSELVALVKSELAFSRASADRGTRGAFLTFLAERSLVFRPEPVDGRSFYSDIPDSAGGLSWYPIVADISRTSDLGYTTGPYKSRSAVPGAPVQHGYYVSLWNKQNDGNWRVVLDIGTPNPAPTTRPTPWQAPASYQSVFDQPASNAPNQRDMLMKMDRQTTTISRSRGAAVAYAACLADDARLHMPMVQPIVGKLQILSSLGDKENLAWQPAGAEVARGADLGYTYGKYTNLAVIGYSYYTRIWKRDRAGRWKIVLEVVTTQARIKIAK